MKCCDLEPNHRAKQGKMFNSSSSWPYFMYWTSLKKISLPNTLAYFSAASEEEKKFYDTDTRGHQRIEGLI